MEIGVGPIVRQPVKAHFSFNGEKAMGQSRRKFRRGFKEATLRRLELDASAAEVARAREVNPNILHRSRRQSV